MTVRRLPKDKRKNGHVQLMDFISINRLEHRFSVHAYNTLIKNVVTQSEFFSFSVDDYMKFYGVGKKTASELVSLADDFRYIGNEEIIKNELEVFCQNVKCAHENELSTILQPYSNIQHKEAFNKIFDIIQSLFWGKPIFKSIYSYLSSIRYSNALYICHSADAHIPNVSKKYKRYSIGIDIDSCDLDVLNYFDEVFLKSCITFIGHNPTEESYMNRIIVETFDELQSKHNVMSYMPLTGREKLYQLKYGRIPAFLTINSYIYRLTDRENRILHKLILFNQSISDIAVEEGLSNDRTRQIFNKIVGDFQEWAQKDGAMDIIKSYEYDELAYIIPSNSNYFEIKLRERFDFDFDFFCFIISIMYDDVFTLYERNKIQEGETSKITYLCNRKITNVLDIVKIQNYIQKKYNKPLAKEIALNPILGKHEFWRIDKVNDQTINSAKGLLIYICQECYGLKVTDADKPFVDLSEHLTPERIKSVICNILSRNNAPTSMDAIKTAMVQLNSQAYENLSIDTLKAILSDKSLFTQIGLKAIYILSTSRNYAGSVHQSIRRILTESAKPMKMQELIQKVLLLRPDSNVRSVRAVITSMIKNNECAAYDDSYVGLNS